MALVLLGPLAFRPTDTAKTSSLAGSRAARPGCQRLSLAIDHHTLLSNDYFKLKNYPLKPSSVIPSYFTS